jgi:hypothetical protein
MTWAKTFELETFRLAMPVNSDNEAWRKTESAKFFNAANFLRKFRTSCPYQGPYSLFLGMVNFPGEPLASWRSSSSASEEDFDEESKGSVFRTEDAGLFLRSSQWGAG